MKSLNSILDNYLLYADLYGPGLEKEEINKILTLKKEF